jgi:2-polyprenyl-3-methyl-5-hydroxy-6-metoxy-1,4-benzoquinol methylase
MNKVHKHKFKPSSVSHYEVCSICDTLHRVSDVAPSQVYADSYWSREGHSNIHEQVYNVSQFQNEAGETKIGSVLKHIPTHSPVSDLDALEIACAPGAMLGKLSEMFHHANGVEYSDQYEAEIRANAGDRKARLIFGPFPDSTKDELSGYYDFICAMDFLEHIEDGQAVMDETKRLLADGGTAAFMSPFLFCDGLFREQDRHPEHIWLYSHRYLQEWLGSLFSEVKFDRFLVGHELVILKK